MKENCLFCKIAKKLIDTKFVYEDDQVVAFDDINPKAPVHILIIPKKHIQSINEVGDTDRELLGHMILVAKKLAKNKKISASGYRLVFNTNKHSGQEVDHIHLHLLGGKQLGPLA